MSEYSNRINQIIEEFNQYTRTADKLNGPETKRKLMKMTSQIETVSAEYGFDITLSEERSKWAHECAIRSCHACRSPKEARWFAGQIAKDYAKCVKAILAKRYENEEKYKIIPYLYLNNGPEFSGRMEALAADYITEQELNLEVDDLWNDATAEQAYYQLEIAQENNSLFYADEFFFYLVQSAI